MSATTPPPSSESTLDPKDGLLFGVADQLIPLFTRGTDDFDRARKVAISALEAYYPETRADLVNIARTIAFSMASLSLVGQAMGENLKIADKLRVFGRANALNRSADQSERTMMMRRRTHNAERAAKSRSAAPVPRPELSDAQIQASVAEIMTLAMDQGKIAKVAPVPPQIAKSAPILPKPTVNPVQAPSAIRYNNPVQAALLPRSASNRDTLLRQTAMQRGVEQHGIPQPA